VIRLRGYPWDAVRALALPPEDYAVFGSAPILAYGLISEVGDIDILATGSAWQAAQKLGTPKVAPGGDRVIQLSSELAIFDGWLGLDVAEILARSSPKDGLPIAQLDDVAAYKRLLNRPKDRAHLKLLEPYLAQRSVTDCKNV